MTEIPAKHLRELDEDLDKLRQFNDEAFHKFAPVIPFEPFPSDVFLVGVMGSGITLLTQIAHGLRSNASMDFEDINEVVPWFHAALLCGQDVDEPQKFNPRLYKTHQLYEKLPEEAKFIVLFRDPEDIFLTRYRRYCNSSWTEYARVPREKITLELFAAGMFANMHSGNEVWQFMRSWLLCCMGQDRVLFLTYEDLQQQPEAEIRRIAHFILPHRQISEDLLNRVKAQSTRQFMQEHLSKFDDHFVLKHLPPFKQDVKAYGRTPRIPKVMTEISRQELPKSIQDLFQHRWRGFLETEFASYRELRSWLNNDDAKYSVKHHTAEVRWMKGILTLLAATCVLVFLQKNVRLRAFALIRRSLRGSVFGSRSL